MFININGTLIIEIIKEMFYIDKTIFIQCFFGILFSVVSIGLFIFFAHKYNKRLENKQLKKSIKMKVDDKYILLN